MNDIDPEQRAGDPLPARPRLSRRVVLTGAVAVGAAGVAAIGVPLVRSNEAPSAAPTTPATDPLDAYHPGDAAFFARFSLPGAEELEHYATVESMARSASTVVVGRVVDVVHTRTIVGEGQDRVVMLGLVIQPRVLRGALGRSFRRRLVVEFVGGSAAESSVTQLRQSLPQGDAIWFLRAKAQEVARYKAAMKRLGRHIPASTARAIKQDARYYRLVSSQGLLIQGRRGVENPLADPQDARVDPLQKRTRKIRKLSDISTRVRTAR